MVWTSGRPRVLLADGDDDGLTRVAARLEQAGCDVLLARDGVQALARAAAEQPDLCVLDAVLPQLNGYELTRRLRADARTRDVPILLMTALTHEASAFDSGADACLPKPCSSQELRAHVRRLLAASGGTRDRSAQNAPRRISTAGTVLSRITRSSATDQRSR